jgi:phosphoglycolate phosphatase
VSGLRYKLVVFDWDGTLLDSIATIIGCTQTTLAELGLPLADEADLRSVIGLGIREMVDSFSPGCSDATFDRIVGKYRKLWFERFAQEPVPFEGVPDLLQGLVEEGRLLAVATAKSRKGLAADLERTGLEPFFQTSRTVDEAASKPSPDMLLGILDELGLPPREALMVGDAVHDLQMAHNAGIAAVGESSGTTAREVLLGNGPRECLERATALPGWLAQNADNRARESAKGFDR